MSAASKDRKGSIGAGEVCPELENLRNDSALAIALRRDFFYLENAL